MEYKELVSGEKIPAIGLGTWGIGGKHTADFSNDEESINAIRAAINLGMTHVDTAEYYGAGHTEELVGRAIEPYKREDLFLTTKVYRTHLNYDNVLSSIQSSLKRIGTKYIDLYLVHWPNPEIPISETMKAMEQCIDKGYTRYIGVSNFSIDHFIEAQQELKKYKLVANQVYFNLTRLHKTYFFGLSVDKLYTYLKDRQIMMIAWSPLEAGRLAKPGFPILDQMAEKYNKTQAQIALNWLITQEKIMAIPKASNLNHIRELIGATGWHLNQSDRKLLEKSFL